MRCSVFYTLFALYVSIYFLSIAFSHRFTKNWLTHIQKCVISSLDSHISQCYFVEISTNLTFFFIVVVCVDEILDKIDFHHSTCSSACWKSRHLYTIKFFDRFVIPSQVENGRVCAIRTHKHTHSNHRIF